MAMAHGAAVRLATLQSWVLPRTPVCMELVRIGLMHPASTVRAERHQQQHTHLPAAAAQLGILPTQCQRKASDRLVAHAC